MKDQGHPFRDKSLLRGAIVFMSLVMSGLGILHIFTGYVPGRTTRLGYAQPNFGSDAQQFGRSTVMPGLLPLCLLARARTRGAVAACALPGAFAVNQLSGISSGNDREPDER